MDLPTVHIKRLRDKFQKLDNPYEVVSRLGITIVYEPLGNVMGYFYKSNNVTSIHINSNLDEETARFTCLHELGHSLLHPRLNLPFLSANSHFPTNKFEREANRFAILFLIDGYHPEIGETRKQFLNRCGVPEEFHSFY